MPRLIPRIHVPGGVANVLIPPSIKDQAIEVFLIVVAKIDALTFQGMVDQDVSIWRQCIPDQYKPDFVSAAKENAMWIKLASEKMILEWVLEAREDLVPVLGNAIGRLWFYRQWAEIIREIEV